MIIVPIAGFSPFLRSKSPPFCLWGIRVELVVEEVQQTRILVTQNIETTTIKLNKQNI